MLRKPRTITASKNAPRSLKPQKARRLIRRFHNLQKWRAILLKRLALHYPELAEHEPEKVLGPDYSRHLRAFKLPKSVETSPDTAITDTSASVEKMTQILAQIDAEISLRGGLHVYQMASTVGQDQQRGGDSLKLLVKWYAEENRTAETALEIGCLSVKNAILKCPRVGHVTRIDLNSQHPAILQQDFMERPLPRLQSEYFDVISCSLVLNFVPSPCQRGEMLFRVTQFLRDPQTGTSAKKPSFFLVLPLPCLSNSRYFDRSCLAEIMACLGFEEIRCHEAKKVIYLFYDWNGTKAMKKPPIRKKREIHTGANRNNFFVDMSTTATWMEELDSKRV